MLLRMPSCYPKIMEDDLVCNFKKCRKRITNLAWVTSCSHIFCEEDGTREFSKQHVCPACETALSSQLDFIQVDIHPSEQYKSMVLAGQRPETIMEICSRAMSFWTYQAHQERAYQEYVAAKASEKSQKQEAYYEQLLSANQSELTSVRSQASSLKKDLEALKTKYNEVSEKLMEKNRQYQKLQGMYESLRRKNINPSSFDWERDYKGSPRIQHHSLKLRSFELPLGSVADRNASLPHNLHKQQSAGFILSSSQAGHVPVMSTTGLELQGGGSGSRGGGGVAGPVMSTTIASGGGGVGGQLQAALPTTMYQLDPTLAAAVNSAAHHTQQAKPFMIKMTTKASQEQQASK